MVPLSENLPARFQRFDWPTSQLVEWRTVFPQTFVLIEGVSATREEFKPFLAFSIYVETDRETRLRRGLQRDGEETKQQWIGWMKDEDDYLERDDPIASADLIVSGNPMSKYDSRKGMTCPFIIGPHGKLGLLEGGALEEKIYRTTDRSCFGGSRRRDDGSGRVPQAQRV